MFLKKYSLAGFSSICLISKFSELFLVVILQINADLAEDPQPGVCVSCCGIFQQSPFLERWLMRSLGLIAVCLTLNLAFSLSRLLGRGPLGVSAIELWGGAGFAVYTPFSATGWCALMAPWCITILQVMPKPHAKLPKPCGWCSATFLQFWHCMTWLSFGKLRDTLGKCSVVALLRYKRLFYMLTGLVIGPFCAEQCAWLSMVEMVLEVRTTTMHVHMRFGTPYWEIGMSEKQIYVGSTEILVAPCQDPSLDLSSILWPPSEMDALNCDTLGGVRCFFQTSDGCRASYYLKNTFAVLNRLPSGHSAHQCNLTAEPLRSDSSATYLGLSSVSVRHLAARRSAREISVPSSGQVSGVFAGLSFASPPTRCFLAQSRQNWGNRLRGSRMLCTLVDAKCSLQYSWVHRVPWRDGARSGTALASLPMWQTCGLLQVDCSLQRELEPGVRSIDSCRAKGLCLLVESKSRFVHIMMRCCVAPVNVSIVY